MEFNFDNDRPIYIQLVEELKLYIISGRIALGEKLPSVRELSLTARVNPNTLQKALSELENEKLIYTDRTNGKYVTEDKNIIKNIIKEMAQKKTREYLNSMNKIGIPKEEIFKYLEMEGKK